MKPKDVLLERWKEIIAKKADSPAIFNTAGEGVRSFLQIEEGALAQAKLRTTKRYNVSAIKTGNHFDWPSSFLACLRMQHVVLPIDESVNEQQASAAFSIAEKSGITDWGDKPPALFKMTSGTTASPRLIRFRS